MIEIRPLRPDDRRDTFFSGDVELDRFFQKFAGQDQFQRVWSLRCAELCGNCWLDVRIGCVSFHFHVVELVEVVAKRCGPMAA